MSNIYCIGKEAFNRNDYPIVLKGSSSDAIRQAWPGSSEKLSLAGQLDLSGFGRRAHPESPLEVNLVSPRNVAST